MVKYDFDTLHNRLGTDSVKHDFAQERGHGADVLPMWVADMDFQTAPEILEALHACVSHGIFGYTDTKKDYFDALANWEKTYFNWEIEQDWLLQTPGVVNAIATGVRALTSPGDAVLITRPVYYPFSRVIDRNARKLVNSPLVLENGKYQIDFADFEQKIIENDVKLFIFCSPHNPVGRVWTAEELEKIGDICLKHNVVIISDEIHADFTFPGHHHIPLCSLKKEYERIVITCTAPSKSFNLAGLTLSNILIPNAEIREKFQAEQSAAAIDDPNQLGLAACKAAYTKGAEWLRQLKEYLTENLSYVREALSEIPGVSLVEPEGTYLLWLDFRGLGLSSEELEDFIEHKVRIWLDGGEMFGPEGAGFQRVNMACPRATVAEAMRRLKQAVTDLNGKK